MMRHSTAGNLRLRTALTAQWHLDVVCTLSSGLAMASKNAVIVGCLVGSTAAGALWAEVTLAKDELTRDVDVVSVAEEGTC